MNNINFYNFTFLIGLGVGDMKFLSDGTIYRIIYILHGLIIQSNFYQL